MEELWVSLSESPFASATWVDWLDVLLLTLIVYAILSVLAGTRAFQSLLGLLLLGGVYWGSIQLGLASLNWVLDHLFGYLVLAMVILFQEDLRRVLARAGGTVFNPEAGRSVEDANLLEAIVRAVFALAGRRIGALVVLERAASLELYCEGAHLVDAVVSDELLQAIFHPSSPVHDGAVVVRGGRIASAGAFLPISLAKNLPKVYGTRHRAAIGLTERADAVCVLVSEERGTVAIVIGGRVVPVVDANDLRQRLQEVLGSAPVSVPSAGAVSNA
jgi:diadenylate cyclase